MDIRRATEADLPAILALLADDQLGATRESPDDLAPYRAAFAAIDADASELLVVAERGGEVVGTLQVSFLPGLSRKGSLRAQVEGVRVARGVRGEGLGETMMRWVLDEARSRGCTLVQLTTDKRRTDAHRFYEKLGFTATHEGYKLPL
ncbi:GNAT family N-acetyltransferase [Saccharothrix obliqua]|uniref:GNAT family N-acetyltransferase n=1 Tax=Saccharothrix obliqua TaxID=2861747 RepID=UPI001C5DB9D9|nr:GNAT family N-acetyltransferase [Saccharothrix obliqua]MBW4721366.1 GNAT family N-acetyltransferase [Saccharothrix obliqua]